MSEGPSDEELERLIKSRETPESKQAEKDKSHVIDQLQAKIKDEDRKKGNS